ncbi:hypothetical protein ACOSP7_026950 [Xanthoceras sorbifolium]
MVQRCVIVLRRHVIVRRHSFITASLPRRSFISLVAGSSPPPLVHLFRRWFVSSAAGGVARVFPTFVALALESRCESLRINE